MLAPPRSTKSLRAAALFGLALPLQPQRSSAPSPALMATMANTIRSGGIVLITGPSGGGKSTLLRACLAHLAPSITPLIHLDGAAHGPPNESFRPLVDTLPGPLAHTLALAASCGLADAKVLLTPTVSLSTGEHARRLSALGLHFATSGALAIDEFASTLDTRTAQSLAHALSRAAAASGTGLLLATNRPSVAAHFAHSRVRCIHCPLNAPPVLLPSPSHHNSSRSTL